MVKYSARNIHQTILSNLKTYLISQYFSKSEILAKAVPELLDKEKGLYRRPFIEATPSYQRVEDGIQKDPNLPAWLKDYFSALAASHLGVYKSPYQHQIQALELGFKGKNFLTATGTGSGKTECFLWPVLAKLLNEAKNSPDTWSQRAVRVITLYPMNALVSDQISRLRRIFGDQDGEFQRIFKSSAGNTNCRRPQFGMYTGRTPYPGEKPDSTKDKLLGRTLSYLTESENDTIKLLKKEGKVPAKKDLAGFVQALQSEEKAFKHVTSPDDAEMLTRFEMQKSAPDILVTNYSMLEYMLLRPVEQSIWNQTKRWLSVSKENKLLIIIDEAHVYRGASGGEVALLFDRLFHYLGIDRQQIQFILTTASLPVDKNDSVQRFAKDLTGSEKDFTIVTGEKQSNIKGLQKKVPLQALLSSNLDYEQTDSGILEFLNTFWQKVDPNIIKWETLAKAQEWLYDHVLDYAIFEKLSLVCQGNALSLDELEDSLFPELSKTEKSQAVNTLLAIAPLAADKDENHRFSARLHMFFRGVRGLYACTNPNCPEGTQAAGIALGKIFLNNAPTYCPHCHHKVLELYNDRRCGAIFFKAYAYKNELFSDKGTFLWDHPGAHLKEELKEIHFYIPPADFKPSQEKTKHPLQKCFLDTTNGYVYTADDSWKGRKDVRELYFSDYEDSGKPGKMTFASCPRCHHQLQRREVTSFATRGNLPFYNLVRSQFLLQPEVPGKSQLPNKGKKVLLFSDSRQRAAKLARDMSTYADNTVFRQLTLRAINRMQNPAYNLGQLYASIALEAYQCGIELFEGKDKNTFASHAKKEAKRYDRHGYNPEFYSLPFSYAIKFLNLFCGPYNTFFDSALCWLEPTEDTLLDIKDDLEKTPFKGNLSDQNLIELFNVWFINLAQDALALGQDIQESARNEVRVGYQRWGIKLEQALNSMGDFFPNVAQSELKKLSQAFTDELLQIDNKTQNYFIDLKKVRPCFSTTHQWYRCNKCSEVSAFTWNNACPHCGSKEVHPMSESELSQLGYWRKPFLESLNDPSLIKQIDVEEHTAQLSHKEQNLDLWSKTEEYEFRFQDITVNDKKPVDILSCTTTMEVGVDIGSLVAVGLRNMPPKRENYQQRAGRAGRRGNSLSTILTYCGDSAHDALYFNDPSAMVRGDARDPWIDVHNHTLLMRHSTLIAFHDFFVPAGIDMDKLPARDFLKDYQKDFLDFLQNWQGRSSKEINEKSINPVLVEDAKKECAKGIKEIDFRYQKHPELFGKDVSLLDALYQDGLVPTYSFPKSIVSMDIEDFNGNLTHRLDRGLDMAINEFAPGRSIVADKQTYLIGGLYSHAYHNVKEPAKGFFNDENYRKPTYKCTTCGWFGTELPESEKCPFCGSSTIERMPDTLKPWGFAPLNGKAIPQIRAVEEEDYSSSGVPMYGTLPDSNEVMSVVRGFKGVKVVSREKQQILLINPGPKDMGFLVCTKCGAALPGNREPGTSLKQPFNTDKRLCHHSFEKVNLGFNFTTDMMVLQFELDRSQMDLEKNNPWETRAACTLAETLRLAACKLLDIEFSEINAGYRFRKNNNGDFIDIFIYDSLSSGAGYATSLQGKVEILLDKVVDLLKNCDCESACCNCIKHFQNQRVHHLLDRKFALDLLNWARDFSLPKELSLSKQLSLLKPLGNYLKSRGYDLLEKNGRIVLTDGRSIERNIIVRAALTKQTPSSKDSICLNEGYLRFALPFAAEEIEEQLKAQAQEI